MSFWKIAWRNMQQRALASSLTGLSMALGVAVMIAVLVLYGVAVQQFEQDAQGFNLVVGAKGGRFELVLNTVYHLGKPIENIPYAYYRDFVDGRFAVFTEIAVPFCLGDSYYANGNRFRIVGTTPDLFDKMPYGNFEDGAPKHYAFEPGGRNFRADNFFEAVIGSVVARQSGLSVNDRFNATHGIAGEKHRQNAFKIVGVLKPTGTANDRALFVNMEGFYLLGNHSLSPEQATQRRRAMAAERGKDSISNASATEPDATEAKGRDAAADSDHSNDGDRQPLPDELREVTAILVRVADEAFAGPLETTVNEGQIAQAVAPARVVTALLDTFVGPISLVLLVLAALVVLVAAISILVSIYNSMNERRHDIAVMRALGASRLAVMAIVLFESILLSVGGGLAGIVLGHGLIAVASPYIEVRSGVGLHFFQLDMWELIVIPSLVVLASLVGLLPAIAAYRTDVAKSLGGG